MLKTFFHRNSPYVKIAYIGGLILTFIFLYQKRVETFSSFQTAAFFLFLLQLLFAQTLVIYPWYPKEAKGPGIRLQFQKAMVPASYCWLVMLILFFLKIYTVPLLLFNFLMLPISVVACILIYFHRLDPDPSSPNELSGGYQHPSNSSEIR